jgi:hypothetical protein
MIEAPIWPLTALGGEGDPFEQVVLDPVAMKLGSVEADAYAAEGREQRSRQRPRGLMLDEARTPRPANLGPHPSHR